VTGSTQSISMSPPPRTAADGGAEHDARTEAGRRAAAYVPWCVESWAGAESTPPGSLADRGRCFGPDCQLCVLHPGMRDVASPSRPFAVCLFSARLGRQLQRQFVCLAHRVAAVAGAQHVLHHEPAALRVAAPPLAACSLIYETSKSTWAHE
jgi:hypothetical protein